MVNPIAAVRILGGRVGEDGLPTQGAAVVLQRFGPIVPEAADFLAQLDALGRAFPARIRGHAAIDAAAAIRKAHKLQPSSATRAAP